MLLDTWGNRFAADPSKGTALLKEAAANSKSRTSSRAASARRRPLAHNFTSTNQVYHIPSASVRSTGSSKKPPRKNNGVGKKKMHTAPASASRKSQSARDRPDSGFSGSSTSSGNSLDHFSCSSASTSARASKVDLARKFDPPSHAGTSAPPAFTKTGAGASPHRPKRHSEALLIAKENNPLTQCLTTGFTYISDAHDDSDLIDPLLEAMKRSDMTGNAHKYAESTVVGAETSTSTLLSLARAKLKQEELRSNIQKAKFQLSSDEYEHMSGSTQSLDEAGQR